MSESIFRRHLELTLLDSLGKPLTESELLSICHSDMKDTARERLIIRRALKTHTRKLRNFFGESPPSPGQQTSPTSPTYTVGPRLNTRLDDDDRYESSGLTPSSGTATARPGGGASRKMHRASTVSIMSSLGVGQFATPPTSPGGTALAGSVSLGSPVPSITQSVASGNMGPENRSPSAASSFLGTKKIRNFFGQRPPSNIIYDHHQDYFPNATKRVLERTATARHSILRGSSRDSNRLSNISAVGFGPGGGSGEDVWRLSQAPRSRFSVSSAGSALTNVPQLGHGGGSSPSKSSSLARRSPITADSASASRVSIDESLPRMSVSTEDGQSIDLTSEEGDYEDEPPRTAIPSQPQLLPPVDFPTETLSESLSAGGLLSTPMAPSLSRQSSGSASSMTAPNKRLSYLVEMRSKKDRSDTASLLTVDEITAEVESRRESWRASTVHGSDDGESIAPPMSRRQSMAASVRRSKAESIMSRRSKAESIMSNAQSEYDDEEEEEEEEDTLLDSEDPDPESTLRSREVEEDDDEEDEDEDEDEEEEGDAEDEDDGEDADWGKAFTSAGGTILPSLQTLG